MMQSVEQEPFAPTGISAGTHTTREGTEEGGRNMKTILEVLICIGGLTMAYQARAEMCPYEEGARAIEQKGAAVGGAGSSILGAALGEALLGADGRGCVQTFERGVVTWKSGLGAHFVSGPIFSAWAERGREGGRDLGYPIGDERVVPGSARDRFQDYENGVIRWTAGENRASVLIPDSATSRDRAAMEQMSVEIVRGLLAAYDDKVYMGGPYSLRGITEYTNAGDGFVLNRRYQVSLQLRYRSGFLGTDPSLTDAVSVLIVDLIYLLDRDEGSSRLSAQVWSLNSSTTVRFLAGRTIDVDLLNERLKAEVLEKLLGASRLVTAFPASQTVLSAKTQASGDLDVYLK